MTNVSSGNRIMPAAATLDGAFSRPGRPLIFRQRRYGRHKP
jgi:hypothetical protein